MKYDPYKHHRRSIRLKGYDYTQAGAYFVTICVRHGQCVLGEVVDGVMGLNNWGRIVDMEWMLMAELRDSVALDVYQVMPNHFHGLFWILDDASGVDVGGGREVGGGRDEVGVWRAKPLRQEPAFGKPQKGALGTIVGAFKSAVTKAINDLEDTRGSPFWQRGYYEQIIKNERHLTAVRQYILNNPANWDEDKLHPNAPVNKFNQMWKR